MSTKKPEVKEDFYANVNHEWLTDPNVKIPDEYPRWGSFIQLHDESLKNQIGLLEELASKSNPTKDEQKLAIAWRASLKRFQDWSEGRGDYQDILSELSILNDHISQGSNGLAKYIARCQRIGVSKPFGFDKECNLEDSQNVVLELGPSGLSLPSRDYYLDEKFDKQRQQFTSHLDKVGALIGAENLQADFSTRVMRFETKLAMITMKKDQARQYDKYYTISTLEDMILNMNELKFLKEKSANYANHSFATEDKDVLCSETCELDDAELEAVGQFLTKVYEELGLADVMLQNYKTNYPDKSGAEYRTMVFDGDYLRRLFKLLLRDSNLADIKAYMQYRVIKSASNFATKDLDEEVFDFYSRKLNGQNAQKSPEKRSVALVNAWLGELLGKIYVERFFSEHDKENVTGMIKDVLAIMDHSISTNDWLTTQTKAKALEKLGAFVMKIGYPDKWKSFDALEFSESDSLFLMDQKVTAFLHQTELLAKINTPKDRTEWAMTPQTVNAYYHPLMNEIVFPAAIIQPPFYASSASSFTFSLDEEEKACPEELLLLAANFGGIGAVIAHEITHGFDNQGKKFSAAGNVENWWTPEDDALFEAKSQLMREQAELWSFEEKDEENPSATPKVHKINGELTLGENLADLGGMSLGCKGLMKRLHDLQVPVEQHNPLLRVFFKSWANIWRSKETKEFIVNQLNTDPHAPCSFRANLVKNVDLFYTVFDVQPGDSMFLPKESRVQMW